MKHWSKHFRKMWSLPELYLNRTDLFHWLVVSMWWCIGNQQTNGSSPVRQKPSEMPLAIFFANHTSKLRFSPSPPGLSSIPPSNFISINHPFTHYISTSKICQALFSLDVCKVPGPDGIPSNILKIYFAEVGPHFKLSILSSPFQFTSTTEKR